MILVDSSVWIAAFRSRKSREAVHLESLLDGDEVGLAAPVRIEILSGAPKRDQGTLRRALSALPLIVPTPASWLTAETWVDTAARSGERFGVIDLLIGVLSFETNALIWSLDADFVRMERLGLISLHRA
ncbi:MAG: PIN domain-containing protein [Thermoanaerobaculia bacterium]